MAKRKSRKNRNQKSSWPFIILLILILAGLIFYTYKTNPEFKSQIDSLLGLTEIQEEKHLPQTKEITPQIIEEDLQPEQQKKEKSEEKTAEQLEVEKDSGLISLPLGLEKPVCAASHGAEDHQIRNFKYYSICYRESYEQAEWSAYCLTEDELTKIATRSDDFRPDPQISTGSASLADYKKSGYDRGHLSPAADFAFSQEAMSESFYMSNMSPQAGGLNRGLWKDLEAQVRLWAGEYGRVYVVSGPVLEKSPSEYKSIGENNVTVPEYYYKVLLAPLYKDDEDRANPENAGGAIAAGFLFPNQKCEGEIFDYAVTIDEIEKRTKLDFFSLLEDRLEENLEANISPDFLKE
ncbi:MAG: DNA/RNA non-specific endonuclease [Treponema sp.]|nr:DNA/RNA non-specific endonuclease [Treponema sp.]